MQSLWMSDFMAVHTLEHLQCIVVMGVFLVRRVVFFFIVPGLIHPDMQNNRDRADAAWSLLGAAIKVMTFSRFTTRIQSSAFSRSDGARDGFVKARCRG